MSASGTEGGALCDRVQPAGFYHIRVTPEQLAALKTVVSFVQAIVPTDIRESEKNEAFWLERGAQPDDKNLLVARENIATFRGYLAAAQSVVGAVFGAKFVPAPSRRRKTGGTAP